MTEPNDQQNETTTRDGLFDRLSRRLFFVGLAIMGLIAFLWSAAALRMLFPNTSRRPRGWLTLGPIDEFSTGSVDTRFKESHGFYIVDMRIDGERLLFALSAACTHLGCITGWQSSPGIFKCPCHGSGFTEAGINFEGPAPRPLPRLAIRLDDQRRVQVDPSKLYQAERGQWNDPACFIRLEAETKEVPELAANHPYDGAKS